MKLKLLIGLCALVLLAGLGGLCLSNTRMAAELAQLRAENQDLKDQQTAQQETNSSQLQHTKVELARLQQNNEELLRLRNEVRQLREEKLRLAKQVQASENEAQNARAQAQSAQSEIAQAQANALRAAQAAQAAQTPQAASPEQAQANLCAMNLRQIEAAKQQWALENNKPANTPVTAADLAPYLRGNTVPVCPAGGMYSLNAVGIAATCSLPNHSLTTK